MSPLAWFCLWLIGSIAILIWSPRQLTTLWEWLCSFMVNLCDAIFALVRLLPAAVRWCIRSLNLRDDAWREHD